MTTKTPGHKTTGLLAIPFEAQEALEVGQPVMVTDDYEVEKNDGTKPVIGTVSVPNKKRTSSISGTSVGNANVPGDVTVEARGFFIDTTTETGSPFDAGVKVGFGADSKLHALSSAGTETNEVVTFTVTGSPTGGDFKLTFGGDETAVIAYNATAAVVQAALEALDSIGEGNVSVSGSAGGPWTATFVGALAGENVGAVTLSDNGLTGGSTPSVTISVGTSGAGTTIAEYGISLTACAEAGDKVDVLVR